MNGWLDGARRKRAAIGIAVGLLVGAGALAFARADSVPSDWSEDWCKDHWRDGSRPHVCEVRDVPVALPKGVLRVAPGENGGVEVVAGKGPGLVVRARVEAFARSEPEARALLNRIRITQDRDGLGAEGPAQPSPGANWNVSFRIEAPSGQALDLSSINGPVAVYGMTGKMILTTENGPLFIKGGGGDIVARATNGPLSVQVTGKRWVGRGLDARTTNGPVGFFVPKDYDADLEYGTINGPWSGPRPASARRNGGYAHVRLGKGGVPLSVTTENGPFDYER